MKTIFIYLSLLLTLLVASTSTAQTIEGDLFPRIDFNKNFVINSEFEKSITQGVVSTMNTVARTSATALSGSFSVAMTASASGQVYSVSSTALSIGLTGKNCESSFDFRHPSSNTVNYQALAISGTTVLATETLSPTSLGNSTRVVMNYSCPDRAIVRTVIRAFGSSWGQLVADKFYTGLKLAAGSNVSPSNLIPLGDIETSNPAAVYTTAATARPTTSGTAGSTSMTVTISAVNPLQGTKSIIVSKSAVNALGSQIQIPFTVPQSGQAKAHTINFDYKIVSGTFSVGSPTTDSDLIAYIFDVGNNTFIEPSSIKLTGLASNTAEKFQASFQTSSSGTLYNLILHQAVSTTTAYDIKLDNFSVDASRFVFGTPTTEWIPFTSAQLAAGTWVKGSSSNPAYGSIVTNHGVWRRNGSNLEVRWTYRHGTAGSAGSGQYELDITSALGLSINTSANGVIVGTSTTKTTDHNTATPVDWFGTKVGTLSIGSVPGTAYNGTGGGVYVKDVSRIKLAPNFTVTDNTNRSYVWNSASIASMSDSNLHVEVEFSVPIAGWGSSTQTSDQTDTRVVAAKYSLPSSVVPGSNAINFSTKVIDTHNAMASGRYTVQVPGIYRVSVNGAQINTANIEVDVFLNGSNVSILGSSPSNAAVFSGSTLLSLNSGDIVDLRLNNATFQISAGAQFSIERLSGPSQISAVESIIARYYATSGQAITGNVTKVNFDTRAQDTHGACVTGAGVFKCTAPISGTYEISAGFGTSTANTNWYVAKYDAAGNVSVISSRYIAFSGSAIVGSGSAKIQLLAGEYIQVIGDNTATLNAPTTPAVATFIQFQRVGNY